MTSENFYHRGMELYVEEKLDEALECFRRALELKPDYADALHALAMTYAAKNRLDEAIEAGKKLVEINPDDELAYTSLSIFYQRKGMTAEAEQIAAKARTLGWKRELQEKKEPEKK